MLADRLHQPDFRTKRRVRWEDVDQRGSVHFSSYLRFMEEAEYAFLKSRGLNVVLDDEKGTIGFPRTSARLAVVRQAFFPEELITWIKLVFNDGVKLAYEFELTGEDHHVVARGRFDVACCRFVADEPPRAILLPDFVIDRIPLID